MFKRTVLASTTVIAALPASLAGVTHDTSQTSARRVYASFDLSRPQGGPLSPRVRQPGSPSQYVIPGE